MTTGDRAKVTVFVAVAPEVAFDVFTLEIDQWWRQGPKFRPAGRHIGPLHLEPRAGGRVFQRYEVGGEERLAELGEVAVWERPTRLVLTWRTPVYAAHESTVVEVRFVATRGGTEVSVEHRGFAAIRPDHPLRHGAVGAQLSRKIGMWWSDLLRAYVDRAGERSG